MKLKVEKMYAPGLIQLEVQITLKKRNKKFTYVQLLKTVTLEDLYYYPLIDSIICIKMQAIALADGFASIETCMILGYDVYKETEKYIIEGRSQ